MGSLKLSATSDGRLTSVAYTIETKLPPMIMVGLNDAMADVPPEATWPNKTEYKFKHEVSPEEMKSADFIEHVLQWVAARLDAGGATLNADITGPIHGHLREAWKSQEPIIMDWAEDPYGPEEQWAQVFSELFSGINYNGTGEGYAMDGIGGDNRTWDEYIYSRLQVRHQEHVTVRKPAKQAGKKGERVGRSIRSWEDPNEDVIESTDPRADPARRRWLANDDPAAPLCCACQYLATYGLITRGFRIESTKKELQTTPGVVGLSAAPAADCQVFSAPGAWFWREQKPVQDVAAMVKESPKLAPGSVYTYHQYHQLHLARKEVVAMFSGDVPVHDLRTLLLTKTGRMKEQLDAVAAEIGKAEERQFAEEQAKGKAGNLALRRTTVEFTGQPAGSHIFHVLRVHKDGTRVQLFDATGGAQSRSAMEAEEDAEHRPLGRGLVLESGLGANMDTRAYTSIYTLDSSAPNGVGIPKAPPPLEPAAEGDAQAGAASALEAHIELMKKARPIGLARFVLTERKPAGDLMPEHVLFVSKLLRTYGDKDHQNYTITRYLWSLRNTPGFTNVQPWWIIFLPRGVLARCMWAAGARKMKLSEFMEKHGKSAPDGSPWFRFASGGQLALDINYGESQILTNIADPAFPGRVKMVRRIKSVPVFPNGGKLVAEGMTQLPPAFQHPLPGLPAPRNVILPVIEKSTEDSKGIEYNHLKTLPWDTTYVRADIQGGERLRALNGVLLDYFRDG